MEIQLQTILQPDMEICAEEELYFHRNKEEICFDGYFNLFYIEKWKRYTQLKKLQLSFRAVGYCMIRLYHNRECVDEIVLDETKQEHTIEFPWEQYMDGVFWFSFIPIKGSGMQQLEGYYTGICEKIQHVAIGIDICTYRREAYVLRNLKVLCERVLQNEELQVSKALWGYIIDNGKTLDTYEPLQQYLKTWGKRVSVIPNKNAGGAGGFTRGMLEVLKDKEQRKLTHVVLMDDDAVLEPDLFVRMYGFLCVVKPEWKDIILGGTMLREDKPYLLYASGEKWEKGLIISENRNLDLRKYENASCDKLISTRNEKKQYSGWWCSCFSLKVVTENNLPMPIFIHYDDIEFGLRNRRNGVVFLNGVGVWHRCFEDVPTGSNLYYDIRNNLINITRQYNENMATYYSWSFYWKRLAIRIIRGKKRDIIWMIQGAYDFLKGPKWLYRQNPEQLNKVVRNINEPSFIRCIVESIKVCGKLLIKRKKVIRDYQNNMDLYTDKKAWIEYLK